MYLSNLMVIISARLRKKSKFFSNCVIHSHMQLNLQYEQRINVGNEFRKNRTILLNNIEKNWDKNSNYFYSYPNNFYG